MSYEYIEDKPDDPRAYDAERQAMAEQPRDTRDPDYVLFFGNARVSARQADVKGDGIMIASGKFYCFAQNAGGMMCLAETRMAECANRATTTEIKREIESDAGVEFYGYAFEAVEELRRRICQDGEARYDTFQRLSPVAVFGSPERRCYWYTNLSCGDFSAFRETLEGHAKREMPIYADGVRGIADGPDWFDGMKDADGRNIGIDTGNERNK